MGYKVASAGTMDTADQPASDEAIAACAAKGIDIKAHKSGKLSFKLIEESDLIFVMERMHQRKATTLSPEAANKCELLAVDEEIADPIGQSQEYFNYCAELIEKAVRKRISEFVI
jgi:protein-tyrosine-phosphatase